MRLIDANALKKAFSNMYREDYERWIKEVIDNAPTIELEPNDCVLTMFGKCSYKETGCSDCYIKARIRRALDEKCYEIGHADGARLGYKKGLNDARSKGKWIESQEEFEDAFIIFKHECSNCKEITFGGGNFCPNCGADMRGEENG